MKYAILFLGVFFFFTHCESKQTNAKNNPTINLADSLTPFRVILYSGDEAIRKYEINVYKKSNKVYAENLSPLQSVGKKRDSVWIAELDSDMILACINFIAKAKMLPRECEETSSILEDYTIIFAPDSLKIKGNCDWGEFDFVKLQEMLFRERF